MIENYLLREIPAPLGAADEPVRELALRELFRDPKKPLVLTHFMYGKKQEDFCPMGTMWADGHDGVVPHLDGKFRGMDLLSPVWNFLDLTPEGRENWLPKREYGS